VPPIVGVSPAEDEYAEDAEDPCMEGEIASRKTDTSSEPPPKGIDSPLFSAEKSRELNEEWQRIQVSFVDEPQAAVKKADALVNKTIDTLAASFSGLRTSLEKTWERDKEVSTEDLRQALQSYRSFFRRLLSILTIHA